MYIGINESKCYSGDSVKRKNKVKTGGKLVFKESLTRCIEYQLKSWQREDEPLIPLRHFNTKSTRKK